MPHVILLEILTDLLISCIGLDVEFSLIEPWVCADSTYMFYFYIGNSDLDDIL